MRRVLAIIALAALVLCGCGEKAEETAQTTLTGIVMSIDGTVVQLIDSSAMGGGNRGNRGEGDGERPTMPEGDFTMPEGDFTFPEGEMPTMPEGMTPPEGFEGGNRPGFGGQRPEGAEGDFTMPEGDFTMPEGAGGNRFNTEDMETTAVDLKDAHISLELEDGSKAAGSMSDITVGSRLTITMEGDKAVRVVVGQSSFGGFGGGNMPNFGGQGGNRGDRPNRENNTNQS